MTILRTSVAEGAVHLSLVKVLISAVKNELASERNILLRVDGKLSNGLTPPLIDNHRPDVHAVTPGYSCEYIGEAKPNSDLLSDRSLLQIECFIRYTLELPSRRFFLSVEPDSFCTGRNLIRQLSGFRGDLPKSTVVVSSFTTPIPVDSYW